MEVKTSLGHRRGLPLLLCLLFLLMASLVNGQERAEEAERRVREKVTCTENLKKIYEAIQAYRRVHKDLPAWLSDLIPEQLADVNALTCPVTKRTGKVANYNLDDPKVSTSYLYEFCARPVPTGIQGGSAKTMKEWKQRQMSLVGSVVPMVRCHQHSPVLNLSFDGRVYEGPVSWEAELKDVINPGDLVPKKLFATEPASVQPSVLPSPTVVLIPGRDPATPMGCLDLSTFFNAGLTEPWHEPPDTKNKYPNNLGRLPQGTQTMAGIPFDVRGIVQLASRELRLKRYPPAVQGIRVGRPFNTAHFLHGTGWPAATGTRIGTYAIRYADGESAEVPIVYGKDVRDWWYGKQEPPESEESVVAWTGQCATTQDRGVTLRLYKSQWQNPRPEAAIETIDFISSMAAPAPFLIAITVE